MEDTILIHGDHWKISDIQDEIEWCRKEKWQKKIFTPRDAIKHHLPEYIKGKIVQKVDELIKGGWDHEHCQICWWKIYESNDPQISIGYTNGHQWLCTECYEQFIENNVFGTSSN